MSNRARMEVTVYPLGTCGGASVSKDVARIFKVLDECGLPYEITLMGTIVEGTADELFGLGRRLHEVMFEGEVERVVTMIRIDERRDETP